MNKRDTYITLLLVADGIFVIVGALIKILYKNYILSNAFFILSFVIFLIAIGMLIFKNK